MLTLSDADEEGESCGGYSTIQKLLEMSMHENGDLMFKSMPSPALLIQLPRCDGVLQRYKHVVPNPRLSLASLLAQSEDISNPKNEMTLKAVICIRHSHYTAFLKCKDNWVYYDSMYGHGTSNVTKVHLLLCLLISFKCLKFHCTA
jgi:hypothetical protein